MPKSNDIIITSISTQGSSLDGPASGGPSFDVTVVIDADPTDELNGLTFSFQNAPNAGVFQSLFGVATGGTKSARPDRLDPSPGLAKQADLAELIEISKMAETEDAFVFVFAEDGTVRADGCYFCDDNPPTGGNGVIDPVELAARKCTQFTSSAVDASDNTPVDSDGLLDLMLIALGHGEDTIA